MFKCLQIICAKYYMSLGIRVLKKNCTSSKFVHLLDKLTKSKFALFLVSDLKGEKLLKKANLLVHENSNMQTLFWSLLNISAKCHQNRFV